MEQSGELGQLKGEYQVVFMETKGRLAEVVMGVLAEGKWWVR